MSQFDISQVISPDDYVGGTKKIKPNYEIAYLWAVSYISARGLLEEYEKAAAVAGIQIKPIWLVEKGGEFRSTK